MLIRVFELQNGFWEVKCIFLPISLIVENTAGQRSNVVRYMLIAALSYSIVGLSVHALGENSWTIALFARALFGLPFAWYGAKGIPITKDQLFEKSLLLRSALAVSFIAFFYYSLQIIRPGDAFALVSMRPLWVAGIYVLLKRSKTKLIFWLLSIVGVFGVVLMEGSRLSGSHQFILIACSIGVLGAGSTITIDLCKSHSDRLMTLHYTGLMFLVSLVFLFLTGSNLGLIDWLDPKTFLLFVLMGSAGNLYTLFSIKAVKKAGAEVGSSIVLLTTVFAYVAGHLIWRDGFSLIGTVGIILTLMPCISIVGFGNLLGKNALVSNS